LGVFALATAEKSVVGAGGGEVGYGWLEGRTRGEADWEDNLFPTTLPSSANCGWIVVDIVDEFIDILARSATL
jgi:hypothetical protein